jgi:hypothetical protein
MTTIDKLHKILKHPEPIGSWPQIYAPKPKPLNEAEQTKYEAIYGTTPRED